MYWLLYLEKGPPNHLGSTPGGQISCKWTLRDELVTEPGEIQSWHSSCFLRNNKLLAAGKTLIWYLPDFQSFLPQGYITFDWDFVRMRK